MKKVLVVMLALVMVLAFAACGGSSSGGDQSTDFEWTRTGLFADENDNNAYIQASEMEEYPGWSVTFIENGEPHGWFIQQEGETLHGDLTAEYEEDMDPYVVTISEEGEDGIMVEVEGGETYHLTPQETPEVFATFTVNVEGVGEIGYCEGEGEPEFEEEIPCTSVFINMAEPTTYTVGARETVEDYKFSKWTLNGEDYSEEPTITVEANENTDLIAVFEFVG